MAPEPRTTSWLNGRGKHLQARGVAARAIARAAEALYRLAWQVLLPIER
jgi:hypothetical protein